MSLFITFDKAPWNHPTGYVMGDKPKYPLNTTGAWRPLEGMASPGEPYYAVLGCPEKMDCIVYCLEVPSGVVVGYDRRSRTVIRPRRAGMGVVMTFEGFVTVMDVLMASMDWHTVVSRVPDEDFGEIREWRGGDYTSRDFLFSIEDPHDAGRIYSVLRNVGISYVKPHGGKGVIELLAPNRAQLRSVIEAGYKVMKDWAEVQILEDDNEKGLPDRA